jgi:hypothetical protein
MSEYLNNRYNNNRNNSLNYINKIFLNKKGIVFYNSFPNNKCAETELLMRFRAECEKLSYIFVMIDNDNRILLPELLKNTYINSIPTKYLLFGMSLHYSTRNKLEIPCLLTLFNPLEFFMNNPKYTENINSYTHYTSCGSNKDRIVINDISKLIGNIHTSLSGPVLPITYKPDKIFYCGINWDKSTNTKARYHDLLHRLDNDNIICLYGPKKINSVIDNWDNFRNYVGEIPFDGYSVVYEINKCGVGLVLTSREHVNDEIVSNRLFECICAGVPIIANKNSFILRWFSDNVFYIDIDDTDLCYSQIKNYMDYIKNNSLIVKNKIIACREIFTKHFSMNMEFKNVVQYFVSMSSG